MDADSPLTRIERTFWSAWYYITGAVNRFLRSEPTDSVNNDPSSLQESSVDTEGSALSRAIDEVQPPLSRSAVGSSRPVVTWEVCSTVADSRPNEESVQLNLTSTEKVAEEGESEREEPFTQSGNDNTGTPGTKHAKRSEDEQKQDEDVKVDVHGQDEMLANGETCPGFASLTLPADAISENMAEIGEKASAEEETHGAPGDHQDMDETLKNLQLKDEDDENQLESEQDMDTEVAEVSPSADLSLGEAEQKNMEELKVQGEKVESHEEGESIVSVLQLVPEPNVTSGEEPEASQDKSLLSFDEEMEEAKTEVHLEPPRPPDMSETESEDDQISFEQEQTTPAGFAYVEAGDQKEGEDESASDDEEEESIMEEEAAGVLPEPANKQAVVAPEKDVDTFTKESHSEDVTAHACRAVHFQEASTEALATDGKLEDDAEVQIETSETRDAGVNSQGIGVDERSDGTREPSVKEEGLTSAESHMESDYVTTSITVRPEGETGKEVNADFRDIPPGVSEGRAVVSQGLYASACKESQEAVPVYNNEPGPDENTTQWFLEIEDYEETRTAQLPEEVETKEPESLQNSGSSSGAAEGSPADERMEDGQDSRFPSAVDRESILSAEADILSISAEPPTETALVEPVIEDSAGVSLLETAGLLDDFMKTAVEKEPDAHDGWTEDKSNLHDVPEEVPDDSEDDEGSCGSKEAEALWTGAAENVAGFTESNVVDSETDSSRDSGLMEDATDAGFVEESVEADPGFAEQPTGETQAMEEAAFERQELAEDPPYVGASAELTDEEERDNISGLELSTHTRAETPVTLFETIVQLSDEMAGSDGALAAAEFGQKLPEETAMCAYDRHFLDNTGSGGQQGPSDEEIFDLWLEAALPEETSGSKQQQQMDPPMDLTNEQEDEYPQQQKVELQSEELGLDDLETSPSTAESDPLHQPLTHHSDPETQQLALAGTDGSDAETETDALVDIMVSVQSRSSSEESVSSDSGAEDGSFEPEKGLLELTPPDELPELDEADEAELPDDQIEVDGFALDFAAQKSRIAVKNPRVRPPKDPRSLLHKPSVEPIGPAHKPGKVLAGVPLGGLGMGIKLPGLGAGFPVLRKTPRVEKEKKEPENSTQELEAKPEEDTTEQEERQHKPRWTPPRHPGFGNPLMSELKTKLKKTPKE